MIQMVNMLIDFPYTVRDVTCYEFTASNNNRYEEHVSYCEDNEQYLSIPRNKTEVQYMDTTYNDSSI